MPILVAETPEGEVIQMIDSTMIISSMYSHLFDRSKGKEVKRNCSNNPQRRGSVIGVKVLIGLLGT